MRPHSKRWTIGILPAYQVYGNLPGYQDYEGTSITDYLLNLIQGALAAARDVDCNVLVGCGMGHTYQMGRPFPAWYTGESNTTFVPLGPWNTDGLIVIPPLLNDGRSHQLAELRQQGFPVVFTGTGEPAPLVMTDASTIALAARHLLEHGHRRIAFLAGYPPTGTGNDSSDRLAIYEKTIKECGLELDESLIAYGFHNVPSGKAVMQRLLAIPAPATAVICSDYSSAIGALQAINEANLRVPEEIALIAYDDFADAWAQEPPLTTGHQRIFDLGYQAVCLILDYIEERCSEPVTQQLPEQLVLRHSCGCEPAAGLTRFNPLVESSGWQEVMARQTSNTIWEATQRVNKDELYKLCRAVTEGWQESTQAYAPQSFLRALEKLIDHLYAAGEDPQIIGSTLNILHSSYSGTNSEFVEAILAQAQSLIYVRTKHFSATNNLQEKTDSDYLGIMTTRLQNALNESQILETLETHLPSLGIDQVRIAFLEAEGDDPTHWSLLWDLDDNKSISFRRIRTRELHPDQLFSNLRPCQLAITPLFSEGHQLGYMMFAAHSLHLLAIITRQVAAAIRVCELYRQAVEGKRLADEANQMKSRFLSMVSHELRTPLNLILGLSDMFLRNQGGVVTDPAQHYADLERIHANAEHLGRLISDVLDLATSEAGQLRLVCEPLNLREALNLAVIPGRQLVAEKGLAWADNLETCSAWVQGDRMRICQVALNLISNASKFTPSGTVSLIVTMDGEKARVEVKDTGMGISPDEQAIIFGEFSRSETAYRRGIGGMGLGLAISQRLVEKMGGTISVSSTGIEGEGSTFSFTLPTIPPPAPAIAPESAAPRPVLFLTSHAENNKWLVEPLQERGFELRIINLSHEQDWLAGILSAPPGAILLDQQLAREQGWEILAALKRHAVAEALPVLICGREMHEQSNNVLELDYLFKPLTPDQLGRALQTLGIKADTASILVVDDETETRAYHLRLLREQLPGCLALEADGGRSALELLRHRQVDLVLLDLMMPDLDGFAVLREMRSSEATRETPVIVLTARTLSNDDMNQLNQRVTSVLTKGVFSSDEVINHVEMALSRNHLLGTSAQRLARRAIAYIQAHYSEPISRKEIANYLGVHPNYLTASFQEEMQISLVAYLNRFRIHKAAEMLDRCEGNITEIAFKVGFSDSTYFSRMFQREMGLSPREYMKRKPGI